MPNRKNRKFRTKVSKILDQCRSVNEIIMSFDLLGVSYRKDDKIGLLKYLCGYYRHPCRIPGFEEYIKDNIDDLISPEYAVRILSSFEHTHSRFCGKYVALARILAVAFAQKHSRDIIRLAKSKRTLKRED